MRKIEEHKIGAVNSALSIIAVDAPGAGGDSSHYAVDCANEEVALDIRFHRGSPDAGINGVTNEVLLAIVADRLRGFQTSPFACKANACALTHIEEAMHWLQQRTISRISRGVEGTQIP